MRLWDHQLKALKFMQDRDSVGVHYHGLFMAVRTGKTAVALTYARDKSRVLVLQPKKVDAWIIEAAALNMPHRVINLTQGSILDRVRIIRATNDPNVLFILNYDVLSDKRVQSALATANIDLVIADEAQRLKSHNSKQSKAAALIPATYRLALTGTPFHNRPLDVFGIGRFLSDKIFGKSWNSFRYKYGSWYGPHNLYLSGYKNLDELARVVDTFAFTVTHEQAAAITTSDHIERLAYLTDKEQQVYDKFEREMVVGYGGAHIVADNPLVRQLRLHQMVGGWVTLDNNQRVGFSHIKQDLLEQLISEIYEPVVLFYNFDSERESIERAITDRPIYWINGHINQLDDWRVDRSEMPVIAVQVRAGAEGLNLKKAKIAIFYSLNWSLGTFDQALGRIYDAGTERHVTYFYLIIKNTIDEALYEALQNKGDVVNSVLRKLQSKYIQGADSGLQTVS